MASSGSVDNGISQGPFSLVRNQYQQAFRLLEAFSHSIGMDGIIERSKRVVEMPLEKRFTESAAVLFSVDDNELNIEEIDVEVSQLFEILTQSNEHLQEEMCERLVADRKNGSSYVIFLALIEELKNAYRDLHIQYESDTDRDTMLKYLSRASAIYSRFVLVAAGESEEFDDEFLRDIARSEEYRAKFEEEAISEPVSELSEEEVEKRVLLRGAIIAYQRVSISVSRGAELAQSSRKEFEAALKKNGIEPNYGPSSVEDLRSGPVLSKE